MNTHIQIWLAFLSIWAYAEDSLIWFGSDEFYEDETIEYMLMQWHG